MWMLGESFNLMTLGGLAAAIGLVIDDAIVVVENIVLHRDAGEGRIEAVRKALHEITTPLIGSTITPVVVFLPLIAVTGVTGSFFRALALTMTASLLTSLVLALTWTPSLGLVLLRAHHAPARTQPHQRTPRSGPHPAARHELASHARSSGRCASRCCSASPAWCSSPARSSPTARSAPTCLPEMDEGGFVLDYIMPAGSSLAETNRVLEHVEQILRNTPEVENTSRRTGLQLGLAAVTEANTGDFTVKLKSNRSRGIDEIMDDVRNQIKTTEPELDVEFTQVLQDMIGDLSNAPEPIQIKLFANDPQLLNQLGPRVADAISKVNGVVDVENGVDNTISGPATNFQVDPTLAARMGFTSTEVAEDATSILDGVTANAPLIANGRPYTIRVRLGDNTRASLDAIENTVFNSSTGHLATLGSMTHITQLPPQNEIHRENLQQLVVVTGRLEGTDLGTAVAQVQKVVASMHLPPSVRVEYGGTYQEQQKSFADLLRVLLLALVLVFGVLLAEFRNLSAPIAILASSVLSIGGVVFGSADHRDHLQCRFLHGTHHGHRHRREERHSSARCRRPLSQRRHRTARSHAARGAAPAAAHPDDRGRRHLRHAAAGLRVRRGLADAAAAGHRSDRRPAALHAAQPGGDADRLLPAHAQRSHPRAARSRNVRVSTAFSFLCAPMYYPQMSSDAQQPLSCR